VTVLSLEPRHDTQLPFQLPADRRAQIVRLLVTRDAHLPVMVRHGEAAAGFVHQRRERTCPDCLANGRVMLGCETCRGAGVVADPALIALPDGLPGDDSARDPYAVEKVQPYGMSPVRQEMADERDRMIDRLEEQLAPPVSDADLLAAANLRPDGWELARRRMYRAFDYAALDAALEQLRERAEAAYHVLHSVFVYGWQTEPGPAMSAVAELGLVFLSERLPGRLRAPAAEVVGENRDERICRLVLREGWPVRRVAVVEGLSVSQVNRIVKEAGS
jgi:hypothetical protein